MTHTNPFPKFIDSTFLSDFSSCEQKWVYSQVENLARSGTSIHLHAGQCFARGLEVLRKAFFEKGLSVDAALDEGKIAVMVAWGAKEPLFSWDHPSEKKTLDSVLAALDYYVTVWNPATDHIQPAELSPGKRAIEFTFAIPLPGCTHPETGDPMLYAGRFDMLGLYNGTLWPVDEKTTSQLGPRWSEQWDLRGQFIGYAWACREYGYSVSGVIARGVCFLKGGFNHAEAPISIDEWKIDEWLEATQAKFARMVEVWRGRKPVRSFGDACNAYGSCPFVLLCNSKDPTRWKDSEYVRRDWNPLAQAGV